MKISARAFLHATLLLSLMAGFLVPNAVAGSVNTTFGGTVLPPVAGSGITLPNYVLAGNSISGSFSYNSLQTGISGVYNFTGPVQTFFFSIPTPGFPTTLFSDQYKGSPGTFTITIKDTGTKGATFNVHAATLGGSGSTKSNASVDLLFTSSTYTGLALPQTQTAFTNAFAISAAKFTWDPDNVGITARIDLINGQSSVPEPSSLVLAVIAMATSAGFLIARRKAAGALQRG